ncbi:hypothetical protein DFH08DRAFT_964336 [Mycena albidolilacea]|uniref:Uncharacterized protein n=1 Tax=Mycena albidolilacea TaxID=1033008 RepID=A0AAD6ZUD6_9AGAR|nr:hypothetical protein DFH08DRAFT_964336 [Mycena albidolilacea]
MGRRAIYLTAAAKASASRQYDLKYAQSPRGKDVRSTSRQLQQRRKVAQHPPTQSLTSIPYLPPLSPVLLAWCDLPLPEGDPLYEAALSAAAWIDVSDIARWKKLPPFEEDDDRTDPYSDGYLRFTHNLSKVVHGDHMRMQNERDVQRRSDFVGAGWKVAMGSLREEVVELLKDWERVRNLTIYDPFHQSREHTMLQVYIQWQARTIHHLYYLKFML